MTGDSEPTLGSGNSEYKFANYVGRPPMIVNPATPNGDLLFGLRAWVLQFGGKGAAEPVGYGKYEDYDLDISEISSDSCHATIRDKQTRDEVAFFDVLTSGDILREDLSHSDGIAPPEVADQIAREVETVKARLGTQFAELSAKGEAVLAQATALAARRNSQTAESASKNWWLKPNAFGGLGRSGTFSTTETHYLGGWSGHTKTYTGKFAKVLVVDQQGVSLRGLSTIFTIPWQEITDLEVDGAESASKRVTAGRVAMLGIFALAAKKKTKDSMLIVTTASGEQALFHSSRITALELREKLLPIITQTRKSKADAQRSASAAPPAVPTTSPPTSVADELTKLAQLRDSGILSDEEFARQKAKLLG